MRHLFQIINFIFTPLVFFSASGQRVDTMQVATVTGSNKFVRASSSIPFQILKKIEPENLNSFSVSDALKYFAGTNVKDYGGIGGLKTVSVRSLGANHTGFLYNGIAVSNGQGGQTDLGKFSLDNISSIALFIPGPTDILQTARASSYASVIAVNVIDTGSSNYPAAEIHVKGGSFGLFNPSINISGRKNKYYGKLSGEYISSDGDYPFISYEDHKTILRRSNSAVQSLRAEYNCTTELNNSSRLSTDVYYYASDRDLPGAVIFFNPINNQNLTDRNFFVQSAFKKEFKSNNSILLSAKFSADKTGYTDPDYQNYAGRLDNDFHENEKYFSAAYKRDFGNYFSIGYAGDVFFNRLLRSDSFSLNFAEPRRTGFLNNLSAVFAAGHFAVTGNILHTYIKQKVENGTAADDLKAFSPALSVSFKTAKNSPLHIRAFYKNIFRVPSFGELYFTNIGNTHLRPETVKEFNVGITFSKTANHFLQQIFFSADVYSNRVKDRILAVPRQNLFQWSIQNVGKVNTKGVDMSGETGTKEIRGMQISSGFSYSFQKAEDLSDPTSPIYKNQLPYTPEHSGSIRLNVCIRRFTAAYNLLLSSYRYRQGEEIAENVVQGYSDHGLSGKYAFFLRKKYSSAVLLQLNNIFNSQYEIIKFYPMPRVNFRIGIHTNLYQTKFKK